MKLSLLVCITVFKFSFANLVNKHTISKEI